MTAAVCAETYRISLGLCLRKIDESITSCVCRVFFGYIITAVH